MKMTSACFINPMTNDVFPEPDGPLIIHVNISSSICEKCNISTNQHCNVLYDSNRISVIVAGYNTKAMIDTGSSIRAISSEMLKEISNTTY